jgi:adenosylmethionine-8-amino-7-oxononanoate aminotransferase
MSLAENHFLERLLQEHLAGPNKLAAPYVFDIRGGGGFWAVEFELGATSFKGDSFAMLVQARALDNGLIVLGMTGGANVQGTNGDHIILSPAYNITKEQTEKIAEIFSQSVEEILKEYNV